MRLPEAIDKTKTTDAERLGFERALQDLITHYRQFKKDKIDQTNQMVHEYENTLNPARLVYCGCSTPMVGNSVGFRARDTPAMRKYKEFVFTPACSMQCQILYRYSCPCGAPLVRVYGPGRNGELKCENLCTEA